MPQRQRSNSTDPSPTSTSTLLKKRSRPRLPHPFAKTSPGPRLAGSSASPGGEGGGHRDLAIAVDASFVETTSAVAARSLAKWYGEQGGEEFAVQTLMKGGKTVYRIRPRSRPVSPVPSPVEQHSPDAPFARGSFQPPPPSHNSRPPNPFRGSLRTSRSIPALRSSPSSLSPTPSLPPPATVTKTLRRPGSTPTLSSIFNSHSGTGTGTTGSGRQSSESTGDRGVGRTRSNPSAGSDPGDVLGRLLGWSMGPAGEAGNRSKRNAGTAQVRGVESVLLRMKSVAEGMGEDAREDLPKDLEELDALNHHSPASPTLTTPPLTTTVTGASPSITSFSTDDLRLSLDREGREMREVASSDSIRTAKADDGAKEKSKKTRRGKKRFEDRAVYDLFQRREEDIYSEAAGGGHSRHASRTSFASGSGDGHQVSVQPELVLNDDPRFVIWGSTSSSSKRNDPRFSTRSSASTSSLRHTANPEPDHGSPATPSSSPATTSSSSRRWSLKDRNSVSSPASSIRDSMTSSVAGGSGRVLMAATVERLVAELTSKIEVDLLSGTFLVYRSFVRPIDLLRALITRFEWAMLDPSSSADEAARRIVRVRTFVVVRHWMLNHFGDDFVPDRQLRLELVNWLNRSAQSDVYRARPKELRLIKGLKKVAKAVKEEYARLNLHKTGGGNELGVPRSPREGVSDDDVDLDLAGEAYSSSTHLSQPTLRRLSFASAASPGGGKKKDLFLPSPASLAGGFSSTSSNSYTPASFPLPYSQNVVARSFTSALGTFGRFKRMLGNRATVGGGQVPLGSVSGGPGAGGLGGGGGFDDELEYERTDTGDLLWVKDGLERYLEFHNIPREGEGGSRDDETMVEFGEVAPEGGQQTPSEMGSSFVVVDAERTSIEEPWGLGITTEEVPVLPQNPPARALPPLTLSFDTTSPQPVPTFAPFEPSPWDLNLGSDYHSHSTDNNVYLSRPQSARVELDDVDLSDEDEDVVEVKRTLKRLPGAHNLRMATTLKNLESGFQGPHAREFKHQSIDSIESYGQLRPPSMGEPERESVVFVDEEENGAGIGVAVIPHFILDGIDSDDDEPGDVEAALRRLEGLVDASKQKEKARTVERQMEKSAKLSQASSTSMSSGADGGAEGEDEDNDDFVSPSVSSPRMSSPAPSRGASSIASSSSPVSQTLKILQVTPEDDDILTTTREVALASTVSVIPTQDHTPPAKRHMRTLSKRATLATKPSVSKIFNTNLSRPISSRSPNPTTGPAPPTHRSFILLCRTEVLAHQFCLIERDMFRLLSWQELVGGSWQDPKNRPGNVLDWEAYVKAERRMKLAARENGTPEPSTVQAMIARYNLTSNWVASEVVLTFNIEERVDLIAKFIRLAFKCYCQNNYQTLTQIVHGLSLPDVERLKRTWARIPTWEMRKYIGMKAFVAPERNFKLLREVTATFISESGPAAQRRTDQARSPPLKGGKQVGSCLPFLGIFLKDLSVMSEQPTYLDPTSPSSPAVVDSNGGLESVADPNAFAHLPPLPEGLSLQPLVNIFKFRTIATVVQQLLSFQDLAADYSFETEPSLYLKTLRIRCLDSATMQECSLKLAQV